MQEAIGDFHKEDFLASCLPAFLNSLLDAVGGEAGAIGALQDKTWLKAFPRATQI
jgi:hypothetical protein